LSQAARLLSWLQILLDNFWSDLKLTSSITPIPGWKKMCARVHIQSDFVVRIDEAIHILNLVFGFFYCESPASLSLRSINNSGYHVLYFVLSGKKN
jgi:hypothetical protein